MVVYVFQLRQMRKIKHVEAEDLDRLHLKIILHTKLRK